MWWTEAKLNGYFSLFRYLSTNLPIFLTRDRPVLSLLLLLRSFSTLPRRCIFFVVIITVHIRIVKLKVSKTYRKQTLSTRKLYSKLLLELSKFQEILKGLLCWKPPEINCGNQTGAPPDTATTSNNSYCNIFLWYKICTHISA